MNPDQLKKKISGLLLSGGAVKVGFASAGETDPVSEAHNRSVAADRDDYIAWLGEGKAAGMDYLHRNMEVRFNPEMLLPGARTVIMAAFSYTPSQLRHEELPSISVYAYGMDYHEVIKKRIRAALSALGEDFAGKFRICVDTVPLRERFWAVKSGLGYQCDNGMIAVEGYGQQVFLAAVLTTLPLPPDSPSEKECLHCALCRNVCPGKALGENGKIDCRSCISYLSIEHKGELDDTGRRIMMSEAGKNTLFGCDRCVAACPLNRDIPPTEIDEFRPLPGIMTLTKEDISALSEQQLKTLLAKSAMKRALNNFVGNNPKIPSK